MLQQDVGDSAILRQARQQGLERLETARGSADTDDEVRDVRYVSFAHVESSTVWIEGRARADR